MGQHIKIKLSKREEFILNQLINKRTIEKNFELRINIVLMSAKLISYKTMKDKLQTSEPTISFWRHRWYSNYDKLQTFISGVDGKKITDDIQKKITAVACESPQQYELPFSHWTHKELAKQIIELGIVDSISAGHIGRLLKKTNYHRTKNRISLF